MTNFSLANSNDPSLKTNSKSNKADDLCDNICEKREGLPAIWSDAPKSKIQGPANTNWERQAIELPLWVIVVEDEDTWAALSSKYSLYSSSGKMFWFVLFLRLAD